MKKCMICGEENQDVSKYCHMCGFKFVGGEVNNEEIPQPVKRELLKKKKAPLLRVKKFRINKDMIFIGIIILLIIAFGWHYKTAPKQSNDNKEIVKVLQMYQNNQNQQQNSQDSWDFRYKNDFAPSEGKQVIDLFE